MSSFNPLSPSILSEFRALMKQPAGVPLCAAPSNNLAFNTQGYAGACFQTYFYKENLRYPNLSVRDIWFSPEFQKLRASVANDDLDYKCRDCKRFLEAGNYFAAPINGYNRYRNDTSEYPTCLELELSNNCNLECVMCSGELSSKVRANREKRPPLRSPYDNAFVEQLREFIPHLQEIKFLGGEPLLIKHYYRIWEMAIELNPSILFFVTTNGTTLSDRFKGLLARGDFQMSLSLDSMVKETYRTIRLGSDFDTVLRNLEFYRQYYLGKKRALHVTMNPMRMNWMEAANFINFGNIQGIRIWFHTVDRPHHLALWTLPSLELERIIDTLSKARIVAPSGTPEEIIHENGWVWEGFVKKQLPAWHEAALRRERDEARPMTAPTAASECRT